MNKPVIFPTAATLREQSNLNGQSLYNVLAKEFLERIRASQADFEDHTLVLYTAGSPEDDSPHTLYNLFNAELSCQFTELGLEFETEDAKKHYIENCWQGGNADCMCETVDSIKDDLMQLGYGVCDLERGSSKNSITFAILVTWRQGYSGNLYDEHCCDDGGRIEKNKCDDLLCEILGDSESSVWRIRG
jgi:hypothetical protein